MSPVTQGHSRRHTRGYWARRGRAVAGAAVVSVRPVSSLRGAAAAGPLGAVPFAPLRAPWAWGALGRAAGSRRERVGSRRSFLCGFLRSAPLGVGPGDSRPGSPPPAAPLCLPCRWPRREPCGRGPGGLSWVFLPRAPAHNNEPSGIVLFVTFSPAPPRPAAPAGGSGERVADFISPEEVATLFPLDERN